MSEMEAISEPTILDYLNEDCWRAVLDYVPVAKLMRTEWTSRRWQAIVLAYMRRVRFRIEYLTVQELGTHRNLRILIVKKRKWPSFEHWTQKLGPSVVALSVFPSESNMKVIRANCPNLETLTLLAVREETLATIVPQIEKFQHLRRICFSGEYYFMGENYLTDARVSRFLACNQLEELHFNCNGRVTGECFLTMKSTNVLKSLIFEDSRYLEYRHLIAAESLSGLTRLELVDFSTHKLEEIHCVLDKMPKLETLCFIHDEDDVISVASDDFFASVCRLKSLKHLMTSVPTTDDDLDAVTRSCEKLHILRMQVCEYVTGRGVAAVCRNAGPRLTALGIRRSDFLNVDDVELAIRSCPNLYLLDVSESTGLTKSALLARASAARRDARAHRALRLYSSVTNVPRGNTRAREELERQYPELSPRSDSDNDCDYDWATEEIEY